MRRRKRQGQRVIYCSSVSEQHTQATHQKCCNYSTTPSDVNMTVLTMRKVRIFQPAEPAHQASPWACRTNAARCHYYLDYLYIFIYLDALCNIFAVSHLFVVLKNSCGRIHLSTLRMTRRVSFSLSLQVKDKVASEKEGNRKGREAREDEEETKQHRDFERWEPPSAQSAVLDYFASGIHLWTPPPPPVNSAFLRFLCVAL